MNTSLKHIELEGLIVLIDRILYEYNPQDFEETPHTFRYYITIFNQSSRTVKLLGRKWVLEHSNRVEVIEGDAIAGFTPLLRPGDRFSYNSMHTTSGDAQAYGTYHGIDMKGNKIFTRIPIFGMFPPPDDKPPIPTWGFN